MRKIFTLCIVHQHPRVLLGMKKRGFGAGRWNGFGGKVEAGETIEEAAKREIFEEAGLTVVDMNQLGTVEFSWPNIKDDILEVHIFKAENFTGEPTESDEMRPQWFEIGNIPFDQMWADDKYWFDWLLNNKKFKAEFYFDEADQIVDYLLEKADN